MAGRGPVPKEPENRRRRNADPSLEVLPAEGFTGRYPALPDGYERTLGNDGFEEDGEPLTMVVPYHDATKEWYRDWATSPMATKFTPVEWNRLRYIIAPLFDAFMREPSTKLASELRLQETGLGATHADRLRARTRIGDTPAQPAPAKPKTKRRPNGNLRAVS